MDEVLKGLVCELVDELYSPRKKNQRRTLSKGIVFKLLTKIALTTNLDIH
jgi:hypothetical protein